MVAFSFGTMGGWGGGVCGGRGGGEGLLFTNLNKNSSITSKQQKFPIRKEVQEIPVIIPMQNPYKNDL